MEKTGWTGQKRMERCKTVVPLGLMLFGMFLVALLHSDCARVQGFRPTGTVPDRAGDVDQ